MRKIFLFLLFLPITLCACNKKNGESENKTSGISDTTLTPSHILANYQMVWNDEFDGTTLNTVKWNYRAEGTVRNYATVSRNTISLDGNGHVIIKVTKDNMGKYFVGELGTQGIFETTYGYFECRAQVNKQIGTHVAFWLQSGDMGKTLDPVVDGDEVDIFEYHRKTPLTVYHNIHWNGYGTTHKTIGAQIPFVGIDYGFHTFGLEWTKEAYIFYVDGKETWRTSTAVSQHNEYLILSTELTGWGGDPALGNLPDAVTFDYIRVYRPKV